MDRVPKTKGFGVQMWSCTCGATGEADNGKVLRGWGLWRNITDVERFLPQLIGDKESANWHQKTECPVKLCITKTTNIYIYSRCTYNGLSMVLSSQGLRQRKTCTFSGQFEEEEIKMYLYLSLYMTCPSVILKTIISSYNLK